MPYMELARAHLELSNKPMMGTVLSEDALCEVANAVEVKDTHEDCLLLPLINLTPTLVF